MLTPDTSILEDVLLVQLVARRSRGTRVISGRLQKALLLAIWATEGCPVDGPSLALAAGMERAQACYAAQVLERIGLVSRRRAPNHDGRGGGVPLIYTIHRGRLAEFRGEWPTGRWPSPGVEGFGAPPVVVWPRAVAIRDEQLRRFGLEGDRLANPGAGRPLACRRAIVRQLIDEDLRRFISIRRVGELLGIQQKAASRLVRGATPRRRAKKLEVAA